MSRQTHAAARLAGRWFAAWWVAVALAALLSAWPWGALWAAPWQALLALLARGGFAPPRSVAEGLLTGGTVGLPLGLLLGGLHTWAVRPWLPRGPRWRAIGLYGLAWSVALALVWAALGVPQSRLPHWGLTLALAMSLAGVLFLAHPLTWVLPRRGRAYWQAGIVLGVAGFAWVALVPPAAVMRWCDVAGRERLCLLLLAPALAAALSFAGLHLALETRA